MRAVAPAPSDAEPVSPTAPGHEIAGSFRRSVALVCGIDRYPAWFPQLQTAVADARAIAGALTTHGFEVTVLADEDVTRERLRGFLADLARDLTPDDRLLVYFAGHGLSAPSTHGPEGFLLLSDAISGDAASYFAMAELRRLLDILRCRHMLLLLDCCFAGTFQWAARRHVEAQVQPIYRQTLQRYVCRPAWQVLVSASHDETASDGLTTDRLRRLRTQAEAREHSPFAAALLQGLSGEADYTDDGLIIASELELYTRGYVERVTQIRQTPQLYKLDRHDRGEFVFQVPGHTLALGDAPALRAENCPYRDGRAFRTADRALFFGRRIATRNLLECVQTQPFTVVVGPSGSGKSSLLQAGLVPVLQEAPRTTVVVVCPGADPTAALGRVIPLGDSSWPRPASVLGRIDEWMASNPDARLVLIVDQAEQLVTLSPEPAREAVLRKLAHALDRHAARLRVVLAVCSEYEPALARSPSCRHWTRGRFEVPPPTQDELREMIKRPARHHELWFDPPALIDTLINAVHAMPGALAALSATLHALYIRVVERDEDRLLSTADYEAMGGVNGVLTRRTAATLRSLTHVTPAYEVTGARLLLQMITQRGGDWVRRCADPGDLVSGDAAEDARGEALLRTFERDGLLVRGAEGWELAHDALARTWPALFETTNISEALPALRSGDHAEIAQAARAWATQGKQPANLWHCDPRLPRVARLVGAFERLFSARERDFVRRSLTQRRARSMQRLALALAVLAAAAIIVVGWDHYVRKFSEYHASYVRRWGAPVGTHPISAAEASHRPEAVKLSRIGRAGRVERVEILRYGAPCARVPVVAGHPLEAANAEAGEEQRPCRWDFFYETETGRVSREVAMDAGGSALYSLAYRHTEDPHVVLAEDQDDNGHPRRSEYGDGELVELRRDDQGLDIERAYLLSDTRTPGVSERAIHAEQMSYDAAFNVVRTRYLDRSRRPTRDRSGVAGWRARYDAGGNKLEQTYLDLTGSTTHDKNGIARLARSYDPARNQITQRSFDDHGAPIRDVSGVAGWQLTYEPRTHEVERINLDEAGAPTPDVHGIARQRTTYDDRGNPISVRNRDQTGMPVRSTSGAAGWDLVYDAHGNLVELTVVDEHDQPTRNREGYARWLRSYDPRGNSTKEVYYDEHGVITRTGTGIAGVAMSYVPGGQTVEYLDDSGRRMAGADGIASIETVYDARGKITDVHYFGEDRKPTTDAAGVTWIHRSYDPRGNLTEETYRDEAGRSIVGPTGVVTVLRSYDEQGNETRIAFLDEAGNLTHDTSGVSIKRMLYDTAGHRIRTAYLDAAERPVRGKDDVAGFCAAHDARGREIDLSYFDESGHLIRSKDGYARRQLSYDAHGNQREVYLDEAGHPTHDRDGISRRHHVFDARGRELEVAYFDEAGRSIPNKAGVALERADYDELGNEVRRRYFDPAGQPTRDTTHVAGWRASYDPLGNVIERGFFDEDGRAIAGVDGVAIVRLAHDRFGHELARTTLDAAGKPARTTTGAVTTLTSYDGRGRASASWYRDEAERPVALRGHGNAVGVRISRNPRGDVIDTTYVDTADHPTPAVRQIARLRRSYDAQGRERRRQYLDAQDRPTRNPDGVASLVMDYDDHGNLTQTSYLDERDSAVAALDGVASLRMSYDDHGNQTETSYFDKAGKRVRAKDGTAGWRAAHDGYGRVVRMTNFDLRGEPVRATTGVARWRAAYDRYGNQIELVYLDEHDRVVNRNDRAAIVRSTPSP
jgi:hypothetical protein